MNSSDTTFPPLLTKLHKLKFDYANGDGIDFEPYTSFLSAEKTTRWFRAWTGNQELDESRFRIFGQDGSGGHAAFWLSRGSTDLLEQPIVFLGSEGEMGVVAVNFHEYLWLLAGGVGPYEAVTCADLTYNPNLPFTQFAEQNSSVGRLSPQEVVARAKAACPTFSSWIQSLCR